MKKYILTEEQIKKVINNLVTEQNSNWGGVHENPPLIQQMKKFPGGKPAFSENKLKELNDVKSNIIYQVKSGDTISGIIQKTGANSLESIFYGNDLLNKNTKSIQPGMLLIINKLPSGN